MSTDYARWLENEIAIALTFDRPEPVTPEPANPAPAGEKE